MRCLTELIRREQFITNSGIKKIKYQIFRWTKDCQKIFEKFKKTFVLVLILTHYNFILKTWIKINASDFVVAGVLSQMHDGIFKSIVFFSKLLLSIECNYMIYNKKLLTIIKIFEIWRFEITSVESNNFIKIYIDHKNLKYFMTTKQLNRRQVRWAEFFSKFNFKIMYKSKKQKKNQTYWLKRFRIYRKI